MVEIIGVLSLFIGMPAIIVGGIIINKHLKNKQTEFALRERELNLEERRLTLDEQAFAQSLLEDSRTLQD